MKPILISLLAITTPLFAITPVGLLDRRLDSFQSQLNPDNLWPLCQRIDQPCGMEELEINDPSLNTKPLKPLPGTETVRGALDAIIARAPKYQWKRYEYAINIEPKELRKNNPLDKKLKRISLKGMSSTRAALNVLHAARALGSFQPPGNFRLRKIQDIELADVSVRDVLNKIVVADGHAMWSVSPNKKSGTVSLFFGLWDDKYQTAEHDMKGSEYDEEMARIRESWNHGTCGDAPDNHSLVRPAASVEYLHSRRRTASALGAQCSTSHEIKLNSIFLPLLLLGVIIAQGWQLQLLALSTSGVIYAALKLRVKHPYAGRRAFLLWVILAFGALIITLLNQPQRGLTL